MKFIFTILVLVFYSTLAAQSKKPQVLVLADSIYLEPVRTASNMLKDRLDLKVGKFSSYNSRQALENFDKILEGKKWDLIYFNFGMNDLMYRDPATKEIRAMHKEAGGVQASSPQKYEENLRELVKRFKASGAKVVWGSTTPITSSNGILFAGDEIKFNKIAERVMKENNVPIVDMYSHGLKSHKVMPRGQAKTFNYKRGLPLHPPMVKAILRELKLFKPVKGPVKVFVMAGDSQVTGQGVVGDSRRPRAGKPGMLGELVANPKTASLYKHLKDTKGGWASRSDVWVQWESKAAGNLSIGFGERGNMIGPELGFGHALGNRLKQQLLIYKPYIANPSLSSFFTKRGEYNGIKDNLKRALENLSYSFPDYSESTAYEIGGLILSFGKNEKDLKSFESNLKKLIAAFRKDLKSPNLPVVIMGTGIQDNKYKKLIQIQQSVAKNSSNVSFFDTRPFWPDKTKSPEKSPERWYGNAESFYKLGEALANEFK